MKKIFISILAFFLFAAHVSAQIESLYQKKAFVLAGDTLPYRILYPKDFDSSKNYPLILVLHGTDEKGNDNTKQLGEGGATFLRDSIRDNYPAFVVFPQCPENDSWSNAKMPLPDSIEFNTNGEPTKALSMAMQLEKNLVADLHLKKEQIYVTGVGMGGTAIFELVKRMPGVFAAAIPISGGGDSATAKDIRKTAWWVFYGGKENKLPKHYSENVIYALYPYYNVEMNFTTYANAVRNSWENAYREPTIFNWLFMQKFKIPK